MGIRSWWREQKRNYAYQRALAERDTYIAKTLQDVDQTNATIDAVSKLDEYGKEERKLDYLRNVTIGANGSDKRFGDLQNSVVQSMQGADLAPEGKGMGGFFGRMFNGRMGSSSLDSSRDNLQRFTTEVRFTQEQGQRLSYLTERRNTLKDLEKTERAAREADERMRKEARVAEARQILHNAKADPLSPERTSELRTQAITALHDENPAIYKTDRGSYAFERQATAFFKADDLEHNKKVMKALQKNPFDFEAVKPWMKEIVGDVNAMNMKDLDVANEKGIQAKYPKVERLMYQVHLLKDLKEAMTPEQRTEVFGTPEQEKEYGQRLLYIGGIRATERGKLLEEVGNDEQYIYTNERGKEPSVGQYYLKVGGGPGGLWGAKDFEEFKEKQRLDEIRRNKEAEDYAARHPKKQEVTVEQLSGGAKTPVTKVDTKQGPQKVPEGRKMN